MKRLLVSALAIALVGASIASIAQSAPMGHLSHNISGMDSADMQAWQKKMSEAKTDDERQTLRAERQKQALGKPGSMMGMGHNAKSGHVGHGTGAMMEMNSVESQAMREAMQKNMNAAKTDEERHALMAEHQTAMMANRAQMMVGNASGHDMEGMSAQMAQRRQMMQKHMGMMPM